LIAEALSLAIVALVVCTTAKGGSLELARGSRTERPQQPQIAVDEKGAVHLVFGVGDQVRYRRSTDRGKSFSPASDLPPVHAMSLGMRRGPRIAASEASICVTAIGGKQGKGRDGDLLAMRSVDGGTTWSQPVQVNDTADSAREGLHAIAAGPEGRMCCVWLDLRSRKTEVMAATSEDGGATWSENVLVYRSPDGSVCECCHPSVAFDGGGQIHVLWRNSLSGARDMYVATSSDGGKSFGKASKLGTGTWPLKACPMDGGAIAAAGDNLVTVWRRDKVVHLLVPGDQEERVLGPGEQPWVALTKTGPVAVWLVKRDGPLYLSAPGSRTPTKLADHASDPVVATRPAGAGPIVVAWESEDGNTPVIQCQVLSN
jgi:hypothetical protein